MPKSIYKSLDEITLNGLLSQAIKLPNGCLHWGPINTKNYGTIRIGNTALGTHRLVTKLTYGEPLPNQIAMHSCNHRPCINPSHLSWGTYSENLKYAVECGRNYVSGVKGEQSGRSKLKEQDVFQIRATFSKENNSVILGKKYGVSRSQIMSIINRKSWKHI